MIYGESQVQIQYRNSRQLLNLCDVVQQEGRPIHRTFPSPMQEGALSVHHLVQRGHYRVSALAATSRPQARPVKENQKLRKDCVRGYKAAEDRRAEEILLVLIKARVVTTRKIAMAEVTGLLRGIMVRLVDMVAVVVTAMVEEEQEEAIKAHRGAKTLQITAVTAEGVDTATRTPTAVVMLGGSQPLVGEGRA